MVRGLKKSVKRGMDSLKVPYPGYDPTNFFHLESEFIIQGMGFLTRISSVLGYIGEIFINWGGCFFMMVMLLMCWYSAVFIACPANGNDCDTLFLISLVIVFQIGINITFFHRHTKLNCVSHWQRDAVVADLCRNSSAEDVLEPLIDGTSVSMESGEVNQSRGHFCTACNREAPLRSHHCPLCKICVLRKDHHCFVTGACVGLGNQRFFMTFLFWSSVGLIFVIYQLAPYLVNHYGDMFPFGFLQLIGPIAVCRWLFGYALFMDAVTSSVFTVSLAMLLSAGGFFTLQVYYTCYGYTMYEYHNPSMRDAFDGDGVNVGERFRLVFGPNWVLNFVFPMFWEKPVLTQQIANNLFRVRKDKKKMLLDTKAMHVGENIARPSIVHH